MSLDTHLSEGVVLITIAVVVHALAVVGEDRPGVRGERVSVLALRFSVLIAPTVGVFAERSGYLMVGHGSRERKLTTMQSNSSSNNETIFTIEATPLKYGPGPRRRPVGS